MKKTTIFKIVFVLAVILIVCKVLSGQWSDISRELKEMTWVTVLLLSLCSIFFNIFEGFCYYTMGKKYNKDMRAVDGIGCSYYCAFFKLSTLGSGTAAAGMFYLNGKKVDVSKSFGMITINYMLQKVAIAFLCIVFFVFNFVHMKRLYSDYFGYLILGIFATVLVAACLLLVILWEKLHSFLIFIGNKIARTEKLKCLVEKLEAKITEIRTESHEIIKDKKFLWKMFIFNVIKFFGWYMMPCVILGYDSPEEIFLGLSISALATAIIGVIPSPGAIGSTEAIFYALFLVVSTKPEAMAIMLLYRCFTYILPFLIGTIYILIRKLISGIS